MKINYAVNNLRSIGDMSPVELKPLTILVGLNNSGKSTFLRSISLLRQSLEGNSNEPILWYDPNSVDFADFQTAVNRTNGADQISFEFKFNDLELKRCAPKFVKFPPNVKKTDSLDEVRYKINLRNLENSTYISQITIDIKGLESEFSLLFHKNGTYQAKLNKTKLPNNYKNNIFFKNNEIFSDISVSSDIISQIIENKSTNANAIRKYFDEFPFTSFVISEIRNIILSFLNTEFENFPINGKNLLEIENEARRIAFLFPFEKDRIRELQKSSKNTNIKSFYDYILEDRNRHSLSKLEQHCMTNLILLTMSKLNSVLRSIIKSCTSIGTSRNLNQRFFRIQSLDVSDIKTNADNFPMLLYSLKINNALEKFSEWTYKIIGYEIDVELGGGGVFQIKIINDEMNLDLVDTGYGMSKILPVLAQIWMDTIGKDSIPVGRSEKSNYGNTKLISIEHPELHLHPKFQANLADAFASALENYKSMDTKPIFLVETHSDVLINRLGALVENYKVCYEDLQIVMFSKSKSNQGSTEVSTSKFDEEGVLIDWTYGFFNF